jgi:hypothetical protein
MCKRLSREAVKGGSLFVTATVGKGLSYTTGIIWVKLNDTIIYLTQDVLVKYLHMTSGP